MTGIPGMTELDHIQSRIREHGRTPKDRWVSQAIKDDLANRTEKQKRLDTSYWHSIAEMEDVDDKLFEVDD